MAGKKNAESVLPAVEVTFRYHGGEWKRRIFRTQSSLDEWFEKDGDNLAEVRTRDLP